MRFAIASLASVAVLATATPFDSSPGNTTNFACGNPALTDDHHSMLAKAFAEEESLEIEADAAIPTVNVYFHVLASSKKPADGWVADSRIQRQMTVLNNNYNKHGIKFQRAGTTRTVNKAWAQGQDTDDMKKKLRRGSYNDLNLYLHQGLPGNAAGLCPYPGPTSGAGSYPNDGCQILTGSLPGGGDYNGLNDGKAGVHEVGHWFGLAHTFENGCNEPGDYVADTPFEASPPGGGCPTGRNSCPNKPGNDPIHNHMDYTGGKCKTRFTPGQQKRMHNMWAKYRAGK
ncbi:hypothetical protein NPX13_g9210 [Xylaria arbuscula]|uniref:Peptidase M43 pregnancy-associated plasma-A domain-containing protein n=1 Tax=Xylaria arbuscula TaxID=114810 RepID=A0A9W8N797_9PEZI|nr:hypothetical protein NPX13_g9210 [Xylaria arbuscula]